MPSAASLARVDQWAPTALVAALEETAGERRIHLVGGAPRDHWLGRAALDFDLVTDGGGEDFAGRLARRLGGRLVRLGGERFAAFRIVTGDLVVDVWGRGETPIRDELERRDLTVNALAVDLARRRLLDPFAGLEDLRRRRLRAITDRGLADDPLRVVRLARFAAVLEGFTVTARTLELARRAADSIGEVAGERIREETTRVLAAEGRARGVEVLAACGLYPRLWGGADRGAAPIPPPVTESLAAITDVSNRHRAAAGASLCDFDPVALAQALLFSPPGGGAPEAERSSLLTRGRRRRVLDLLALGELPAGDAEARWFLRRWHHRWCEAATFAVLRTAPPQAAAIDRARRLGELARTAGRRIFDLPVLVDGDEIGRLLAREPGPEIGRALAALEKAQVAGTVGTRAEARAFLLERYRRGPARD